MHVDQGSLHEKVGLEHGFYSTQIGLQLDIKCFDEKRIGVAVERDG